MAVSVCPVRALCEMHDSVHPVINIRERHILFDRIIKEIPSRSRRVRLYRMNEVYTVITRTNDEELFDFIMADHRKLSITTYFNCRVMVEQATFFRSTKILKKISQIYPSIGLPRDALCIALAYGCDDQGRGRKIGCNAFMYYLSRGASLHAKYQTRSTCYGMTPREMALYANDTVMVSLIDCVLNP